MSASASVVKADLSSLAPTIESLDEIVEAISSNVESLTSAERDIQFVNGASSTLKKYRYYYLDENNEKVYCSYQSENTLSECVYNLSSYAYTYNSAVGGLKNNIADIKKNFDRIDKVLGALNKIQTAISDFETKTVLPVELTQTNASYANGFGNLNELISGILNGTVGIVNSILGNDNYYLREYTPEEFREILNSLGSVTLKENQDFVEYLTTLGLIISDVGKYTGSSPADAAKSYYLYYTDEENRATLTQGMSEEEIEDYDELVKGLEIYFNLEDLENLDNVKDGDSESFSIIDAGNYAALFALLAPLPNVEDDVNFPGNWRNHHEDEEDDDEDKNDFSNYDDTMKDLGELASSESVTSGMTALGMQGALAINNAFDSIGHSGNDNGGFYGGASRGEYFEVDFGESSDNSIVATQQSAPPPPPSKAGESGTSKAENNNNNNSNNNNNNSNNSITADKPAPPAPETVGSGIQATGDQVKVGEISSGNVESTEDSSAVPKQNVTENSEPELPMLKGDGVGKEIMPPKQESESIGEKIEEDNKNIVGAIAGAAGLGATSTVVNNNSAPAPIPNNPGIVDDLMPGAMPSQPQTNNIANNSAINTQTSTAIDNSVADTSSRPSTTAKPTTTTTPSTSSSTGTKGGSVGTGSSSGTSSSRTPQNAINRVDDDAPSSTENNKKPETAENKTTEGTNAQGEAGTLGAASTAIRELEVQYKKDVRLATVVTGSSALVTLAVKLLNFINILAFVLVLVLIALVYSTYRRKRKQKLEKDIEAIKEKIKLIEIKKEESSHNNDEVEIKEETISEEKNGENDMEEIYEIQEDLEFSSIDVRESFEEDSNDDYEESEDDEPETK